MLYREEIERLSAITGLPSNDYERSVIITLESEIEGLTQDIETREQLLRLLDEQEEASKAELATLQELDGTYLEALKGDIEAIWTKSEVLKTYMGVITNDFSINKLKTDNDTYAKGFYEKLKPFMEKSHRVREKLVTLVELNKNCEDLKQKNDALMAPPH